VLCSQIFDPACSSLLQDSLARGPTKEAKGGKDKGKLKAGEPEELNEVLALFATLYELATADVQRLLACPDMLL
jgi:hypothetical protein